MKRHYWHHHVHQTAMIAIAVALQTVPSHAQNAALNPAPRAQADTMAANLVARMTLDEKIGQLLNAAPAIPRLDVPEYNWWTESLHGALGTVPTTNFPEPIGLAATFDDTLVKDVAGQISVELRALHTLARQTGRMDRGRC
jgi:beta-glucosidase